MIEGVGAEGRLEEHHNPEGKMSMKIAAAIRGRLIGAQLAQLATTGVYEDNAYLRVMVSDEVGSKTA